MKKNNGFTLIEIIVSIAIGSIVLLIIGTLLVQSIQFFSNVSHNDVDKRLVDSIVTFIRDEVEYSTDVRLMSQSDENSPIIGDDSQWHCFYIKDGYLYRDHKKIYSDSFYDSKTLIIEAKGNYQNNVRVDLIFELYDEEEKVYSTRDTLVLLNITVSQEIMNKGLFNVESSVKLTNLKSNEKKDYALYYKKDLKSHTTIIDPVNPDNNGKNGTVADLIFNLSYDNSRGYFNETLQYNTGDYVYYEGYWWMKNAKNDSNAKPGDSGSAWERVDMYYKVGKNSSYLKGDIVVYDGKYYRCETDNYAWTNPELCSRPPVCKEDNPYNYQWEVITEQEAKEKIYEKAYNYDENLVIKRYLPNNIKVSDINPESIPLYDANKIYSLGDIVKVEFNNTGYYLKYYKAFNTNQSGLAPGIVPENGWILIENDYNITSAYVIGDYIIGANGMQHNDSFVFYVPKYNIVNNDEEILNILNSIRQTQNYQKPYSQYLKPFNNDPGYIQAFWTIINGF